LYIDTDYAFDGKKKSYSEDDVPSPLGWYALTKSEGAKRVLALGNMGLVIRISNPYRAHPVGKKDFVHKMLGLMQAGHSVTAPQDQLFAPTFIDDIASALRVLVRLNASGIYHVVGSPLSPFEAATIIAEEFGCDTGLVQKTTFAEMFGDRAPTPQYAVLTNDKIKALGVIIHSFREGIVEVKRQESLPAGRQV
jgi:dTDP-4-dehydrorhamnose reductase